jgi:hypothetical protein
MTPMSRNIFVGMFAVFGLQSAAFAVPNQSFSSVNSVDAKYQVTTETAKSTSNAGTLQLARARSGLRANDSKDDQSVCCVGGRCFPC